MIRLLSLLSARSVLVGTLLLLCASSFSGQAREISSDDFYSAVARYQTATQGLLYRETENTEKFHGGKVVKRVQLLREWDADGNHRTITKEFEDGKTTTSESVWIGSVEYTRKGNGPWQKFDWSRGGTGSAGGDDAVYSVEELKDGFLFTSRVTYKDEPKRTEITKTFVTARFWRRKVETTVSAETPKNLVSRSVRTFDYNPGPIKLKAPIE